MILDAAGEDDELVVVGARRARGLGSARDAVVDDRRVEAPERAVVRHARGVIDVGHAVGADRHGDDRMVDEAGRDEPLAGADEAERRAADLRGAARAGVTSSRPEEAIAFLVDGVDEIALTGRDRTKAVVLGREIDRGERLERRAGANASDPAGALPDREHFLAANGQPGRALRRAHPLDLVKVGVEPDELVATAKEPDEAARRERRHRVRIRPERAIRRRRVGEVGVVAPLGFEDAKRRESVRRGRRLLAAATEAEGERAGERDYQPPAPGVAPVEPPSGLLLWSPLPCDVAAAPPLLFSGFGDSLPQPTSASESANAAARMKGTIFMSDSIGEARPREL